MNDSAKAHAARRRRRLLQNRDARLKSILGENMNEETSNIEEIDQILDPQQPDEELKVYYSPTNAQQAEKKQEISIKKNYFSIRPFFILIISSLFTNFFSYFSPTVVHFESQLEVITKQFVIMAHQGSSSGKFTEEFIKSLVQYNLSDKNTKISPKESPVSALALIAELMNVFVTETATRAAQQALQDGDEVCEVEHIEKILPQILLDF